MQTVHVDAIAPGDHVVHFYSSASDLALGAGTFLGRGVTAGERVLVVATEARIADLEEAMRGGGVDVDSARGEGHYVAADAQGLLDRFMTPSGPDAAAFDREVGALVRDLSGSGSPVRVYGEMVALLWEAGAVPAAAALEDLWNALGESVGFSLYCAYPAQSTDAVPDEQALVRHRHTHVVEAPAPLVPREGEVRRQLEPTTYAVPVARWLLRDALVAWEMTELLDEAQLVLAELVGNAVRHVGKRFEVSVSRLPDGVRLEVADSDPDVPQLLHPDDLALGGRGVLLVSRLSRRWGTDAHRHGKTMWAEVSASDVSRHA